MPDISPRAKWPESTRKKKKKYSCWNAKQFLNEPLPPEQQLLILKGCCCTRPSGCAVKSSAAAAELRFLSAPIRPSDIIHSQMLSHHFFPHHCCLWVVLFICRLFLTLSGAKQALPGVSGKPMDRSLVQGMPSSLFHPEELCCAGRQHFGEAAGLTARETEGCYLSPSRQHTDTLSHAVLRRRA